MPPKKSPPPSSVPPPLASPARGQTSASSAPQRSTPVGTPVKTPSNKSSLSPNANVNVKNSNDAQAILQGIWNRYVADTPQRTKLIDAFMGFLVVVGGLQFLYCVIAGNYEGQFRNGEWTQEIVDIGYGRERITDNRQPFNAFLSGFAATVGQFVLTVSLRMQTSPENKVEFQGRSHERAFADFVLGSVILHFFCVNFIN
ncbi:hypothetical protein MBLNU457_1513t2 [Dothideomycetes sp. NU457]